MGSYFACFVLSLFVTLFYCFDCNYYLDFDVMGHKIFKSCFVLSLFVSLFYCFDCYHYVDFDVTGHKIFNFLNP